MLGVLAAATLLACGAKELPPKWVCQTDATVANKHYKERKCYRIAEFCEGGCEPVKTAQCFLTDPPGGVFPDYPDRMCYAAVDDCTSARERRKKTSFDVHSACHPARD